MKYICCIWLCIVWLVCHAQYGVFGLHVQQAPEIIQRITRQAARYGGGASVSGPNYRPVSGPSSNFNVRSAASDLTTGLTSSQLNSVSANSGQRPVGVGAYSFGGMASGRPTNGNSFAVSNSIKSSGLRGSQQPNIGQTIVGSGSVAGGGVSAGRPQQLQQALLQAAQYQLQQQQQHQQQQVQQQQVQQQQHQQQQQLRRQIPQQQLYRQRPANTYQQYN